MMHPHVNQELIPALVGACVVLVLLLIVSAVAFS